MKQQTNKLDSSLQCLILVFVFYVTKNNETPSVAVLRLDFKREWLLFWSASCKN